MNAGGAAGTTLAIGAKQGNQKMRHDEHLYLKLIEECSEVQHRCSKLIQFGPYEKQANNPVSGGKEAPHLGTNAERLQEEVNDLIAVVKLLGLKMPTAAQVEAKKTKIEKYRRYSESLGCVDTPA